MPVTGSLAIVVRPRGGDWLDDDVRQFLDRGIQVVVSLLCDSERGELGLEEEAAACSRHGIEFISRDLDLWACHKGVVFDFSRPGKWRSVPSVSSCSNPT